MTALIGTDLLEAARLLRAGQLVAIPTETVYGLAANAFDEAAVVRVFETKQRPAFDPLIVHVRDRAQLERVAIVPAAAGPLIARFWPGPLTLVLPKRPEVPDLVTSGLDTVAVRMPAHPLTQELLALLDFPLAAPSANPFGYVSPTTAQHVADQLGERIPYILDGGPCAVGVESTILAWNGAGSWSLLRQGGVKQEDLEPFTGPLHQRVSTERPVAPGMLESHYAPRTPVYMGEVPALLQRFASRSVGVISFQTSYRTSHCQVLSPSGDLSEAARHLFGALRALDASDCEVIVAEVFPEVGLGRAINDRLRRAAADRR
ncbi:MAG: threonylcarbamoyl-AMP synthase [Flavobacteriales bacterium]|nr:threonylcarbamoyl-AMP synthase [Flavobacteriales bacterium]MBP6696022.1 threonylcarbamoyl-AMP synthase [Flavobacteriales bacterium]